MVNYTGWDSDMILPLVKRSDGVDIGSTVRDPTPRDSNPILEKLTEYLLIGYVFDFPDAFVYVTGRHCLDLGVKPEEMRSLAVSNLMRRRSFPQIKQFPEAAMFVLDGNFEASLLLVDSLWAQVAPGIPGNLIAAAPTRDTLIVTGTEVPRGLATLQRGCETAWRKSETRLLLTKAPLIRDNGSWHH